MINFYYRSSSYSSRKATNWFVMNNITVLKKRIEMISKEDLIYILSLTENGFSDILKRPNGSQNENLIEKKVSSIDLMKFEEGVDYILRNPEVLKSPIIVEKRKLLIGFNLEELRIFIPRIKRKLR